VFNRRKHKKFFSQSSNRKRVVCSFFFFWFMYKYIHFYFRNDTATLCLYMFIIIIWKMLVNNDFSIFREQFKFRPAKTIVFLCNIMRIEVFSLGLEKKRFVIFFFFFSFVIVTKSANNFFMHICTVILCDSEG